MSKLQLFQVDAFSSRLFGGNPAAVVPLISWLPDDLMQSIAAENNLAETAFFVLEGERYGLRWFTPTAEVKLCGHATLATAHVLFTALEPERREVRFDTLSGELTVGRAAEGLVMDFPRWELEPLATPPSGLTEALGMPPEEVLITSTADNLFAVFYDESEIRALEPDMRRLAALHPAGVVATARGRRSDCVCRYFAPSYGIEEDSATGSIHCGLAPLWSARLGKPQIHSLQLSKRGAELFCELRDSRILITGQAVTYMEGWIDV
ncbi:MAG TPA: PhzF family phenazine biosynthesis protein [Gammaproteobacteria bacterium]|nr:PhzF family phenazine biosynthesis protein [Gammaproteobacteria bacterium]